MRTVPLTFNQQPSTYLRFRLHFADPPRINQSHDHDHCAGRADVSENLAVRPTHRILMHRIGDVLARTDDMFWSRARLGQGSQNNLPAPIGLLLGIGLMLGDGFGLGSGAGPGTSTPSSSLAMPKSRSLGKISPSCIAR